MEDFNLEQLEELKRSLNSLIGNRITYDIVEMNKKRREKNEYYKSIDYELLRIIIDEIERRKVNQKENM